MGWRIVALVAGAVLGGCGPDSGAGESALEASGTVEATQADLAFQMPGRLAALTVREGDRVTRGQELGRLDEAEVAARHQAAEAQRAAARAALAELEAGTRPEEIGQARQALEAATRRLEEQERETARSVRLAEGGAVSRESRERAETMLAVARADRDRLGQQVALLEAGPRPERVDAQRALVRQAEATVAQLAAVRAQLVLLAPFDGIVSVRHREPGEVVAAGTPVVTVLDPDDRWVRVFVPEDRVGRLSLGMAAEIRGDSRPDRVYEGRVVHIASEAEFTPRNVQTREERVRLVHAVRIRVTGDSALELKPGLAADVRIPVAPAGE